jgi:hypothetical protein
LFDGGFLRVLNFQPGGAESAFDADLRDHVLPRLLDLDEVVDLWVGRWGSGQDRARVLASTWRSDPAAAPDGPADIAALRDLGEGVAVMAGVEQLPLAIHVQFERSEPIRILRVFHGKVRPGEFDAYVDAVRAGVLADSLSNDGLIALALGASPPDDFTTVSVWTGWPAIELATGGNTRQPFATRNSERLASFTVTHYEVLPDAQHRGADRA